MPEASAALDAAAGRSRLAFNTTLGLWLAAALLLAWQLAGPVGGLDTHFYWLASRAMRHGASPYTVKGFVYPPFAAVLVRPLGFTSLAVARGTMMVFATACVVTTMTLSAKALGYRAFGPQAAVACLIAVAGELFGRELRLGNISPAIAALVAGFYLAWSRQRFRTAGVLLGIGMAIKPIALPVLVVPLVFKRWGAFAAALVAAAVCTAVGALLVPHADWFLSHAIPYLRHHHPPDGNPLDPSLNSIGLMLGVPRALIFIGRVAIVVAALVSIVAIRISRPSSDVVAVVTIGSVALIAAFAAGTGTQHHFLWTVAPLFVTLASRRTFLAPVLGWLAVVALASLVPAPARWFPHQLFAQRAADSAAMLLGLIVALAAVTIVAVRSLSQSAATETVDRLR